MKKSWHIGLLLAAGLVVIYLLYKGVPQKVLSQIGDDELNPSSPAEGQANTSVVNTTPGVNQTYNVPNPPQAAPPSSDAEYLTSAQVELQLQPQTGVQLENIQSVGADFSEFVPTSQLLEG